MVCSLGATITSKRYHCNCTIRFNNVDKIVRVIPLVSNYMLAIISNYQRFGFSYVMSLTGA